MLTPRIAEPKAPAPFAGQARTRKTKTFPELFPASAFYERRQFLDIGGPPRYASQTINSLIQTRDIGLDFQPDITFLACQVDCTFDNRSRSLIIQRQRTRNRCARQRGESASRGQPSEFHPKSLCVEERQDSG
jgi:hypothetical protein